MKETREKNEMEDKGKGRKGKKEGTWETQREGLTTKGWREGQRGGERDGKGGEENSMDRVMEGEVQRPLTMSLKTHTIT